MDKEVVVRSELTDAMVGAGEALTRRLDERKWPVVASLWFFFPDVDRWKLILASPTVAEEGPREAYKTIRDVINEMPEEEPHLGLHDIKVTDPENDLLQRMSTSIGTVPGVKQMRISQNVMNGSLIEDTLIYRLNLQPE